MEGGQAGASLEMLKNCVAMVPIDKDFAAKTRNVRPPPLLPVFWALGEGGSCARCC